MMLGLTIFFVLYAVISVSVFFTYEGCDDKHAVMKGLTWPVVAWKLLKRGRYYFARPKSISKMWDDELKSPMPRPERGFHIN